MRKKKLLMSLLGNEYVDFAELAEKSEILRTKLKIAISLEHLYKDIMKGASLKKKSVAPKKINKDKYSLIITIFDSHFGAHVVRNDNSKNNKWVVTFNYEIARQLIRKLFDRAIEEIETIGNDKFDEIIIALGGDNIDGDGSIYTGQIHFLEDNIIGQVETFVQTMLDEINRINKHFNYKYDINIYGVVGNHGELRFNPMPELFIDNADYWCFRLIDMLLIQAKRFDAFKNVNIFYNKEHGNPHFTFYVKGHQFMLVHEMRKNLFTATAKNEILNLIKMYDNLKVIITGHYHDSAIINFNGTKLIRTGSLVGATSYTDLLRIYAEQREQLILVVSSNEPTRNIIPVNLATEVLHA